MSTSYSETFSYKIFIEIRSAFLDLLHVYRPADIDLITHAYSPCMLTQMTSNIIHTTVCHILEYLGALRWGSRRS
jgi:hypothetical protein